MSMTFAGLTRSTSAATSVASRHAVPDALNQFISNSAAYCVGFGTTGGTCVIMLCRPGTSRRFGSVACIGIAAGHNEFVHALILAFVPGSPHTRTNTTSSRYGDHAMKISLGAWRDVAATIGVSPSSRMMRDGFQTFSTTTMTMMHVSELTMSVSSGPM